MKLTDHQVDALNCAHGPIALLTGNPGTGKTTAVAHVIKGILQSSGPGRANIAAAAPTGKAARRMTESLRQHQLQIRASTIHSLLGYTFEGGYGHFAHDEKNPLRHSHVFIDESSMISTSLMASLLAARRRDSEFLLVGDPNQLSPVGHGAPLRDFIDMKLPHGRLTEIHRNAGRIVRCCKSIVEQGRFVASNDFDSESDENLFIDSDWKDPEGQIKAVKDWLHPNAGLFTEFTDDPVDLVWDVQVICPINDKSDVSRRKLNQVLQAHLNPDGAHIEGNPFRVDDKVVCRKNGHYLAGPNCPPREVNDENRVYCANGDQGRVVDITSKSIVVELSLPTRVVRVAARSSEDEGEAVWEHAYAISCHLSQGAEWPYVIVVGDESNGARWLCDKHWVLTAISRASVSCVCVAKPGTLNQWVRKSHLRKRKTFAVDHYYEMLVKSDG